MKKKNKQTKTLVQKKKKTAAIIIDLRERSTMRTMTLTRSIVALTLLTQFLIYLRRILFIVFNLGFQVYVTRMPLIAAAFFSPFFYFDCM